MGLSMCQVLCQAFLLGFLTWGLVNLDRKKKIYIFKTPNL